MPAKTADSRSPARSAHPEGREAFLARASALVEDPPLALALVDIDEFKSINDRHGHAIGDKVLHEVERLLTRAADPGFVMRIAGDEFACALPKTSPEQALIRMERARSSVVDKRIVAGKQPVPFRISVGIASFPQHAEDMRELLDAADAALHRAKREGRDRVSIYVEDKMVLKSNYYPRAQLARLSSLSQRLGKTDAELLRLALADLLEHHRGDI